MKEKSQEIYFSVLFFISVNLSLTYLLSTVAVRKNAQSSPALGSFPIWMKPTFQKRTRSASLFPPSKKEGHATSSHKCGKHTTDAFFYKQHLPAFCLGNNLASNPEAHTSSSEKHLDNWWIFELSWGFVLWRLSASEKKPEQNHSTFYFCWTYCF